MSPSHDPHRVPPSWHPPVVSPSSPPPPPHHELVLLQTHVVDAVQAHVLASVKFPLKVSSPASLVGLFMLSSLYCDDLSSLSDEPGLLLVSRSLQLRQSGTFEACPLPTMHRLSHCVLRVSRQLDLSSPGWAGWDGRGRGH